MWAGAGWGAVLRVGRDAQLGESEESGRGGCDEGGRCIVICSPRLNNFDTATRATTVKTGNSKAVVSEAHIHAWRPHTSMLLCHAEHEVIGAEDAASVSHPAAEQTARPHNCYVRVKVLNNVCSCTCTLLVNTAGAAAEEAMQRACWLRCGAALVKRSHSQAKQPNLAPRAEPCSELSKHPRVTQTVMAVVVTLQMGHTASGLHLCADTLALGCFQRRPCRDTRGLPSLAQQAALLQQLPGGCQQATQHPRPRPITHAGCMPTCRVTQHPQSTMWHCSSCWHPPPLLAQSMPVWYPAPQLASYSLPEAYSLLHHRPHLHLQVVQP